MSLRHILAPKQPPALDRLESISSQLLQSSEQRRVYARSLRAFGQSVLSSGVSIDRASSAQFSILESCYWDLADLHEGFALAEIRAASYLRDLIPLFGGVARAKEEYEAQDDL
jgi:hypothetical protein